MDGFNSTFHQEYAAILDDLSTLSSQDALPKLDKIQQRVQILTSLYTHNASFLPAYEQRRRQEQLKELTNAVLAAKTKYVPKQKFNFKSRAKAGESPAPPATQVPATVVSSVTADILNDEGVTFSTSNAYLKTSPDLHVSNIKLLSMSNTVVNLLEPKRHATLQVKDLERCLILASSFDGSAHLTNLRNCVIVLKCHQFRLHDSTDTKVFLSCSSRPVLENSSGIVFSEYPSVVARKGGIEIGDGQNLEMVEDFNWLRKEHSPNWRTVKDGMDGDTWSSLLTMMEGTSPSSDQMLELVLKTSVN